MKGEKFGTYSGVVIPSVLAIFGAVVFYVAPHVLGGVGLLGMLAIVLLAHSVTLATAFSLSAIATNIHVKEGGLYYLISRSLGIEFGGSMGIQLFLAQTVSVAFYCIAFSKAVMSVLIQYGIFFPEVYITLIAFTVFWLMAYRGASFVVKIQYVVLVVILAAFISIFFASNRVPEAVELLGEGGLALSFWVAFLMFFPAVTGIDAGVGMSGDLKNPRRSLVQGSFIAILITMFMYVALSIKYFYMAPLSELSMNMYVIQQLAPFAWLIILGALLTTSSSALSYLMAAPRTLRALVRDRVFSKHFFFLGKTFGNSNEPRVAMLVTFLIGVVVISFGNLYLVSQIVGIFFLNVYGWINATAFLEKLSHNPSFRPSFNAPILVSFYGMLVSYVIMFLFSPWIMVVGVLFQLLIFYILLRTKTSSKVESVWRGLLFQLFRIALRRMELAEQSKKNWRPTIMAFYANDNRISLLAAMLDWISSRHGITKLYYLSHPVKRIKEKREKVEHDMREYVKDYQLENYPKAVFARSCTEATQHLIQSETLGNLPWNTVLLDYDSKLNFKRIVESTTALNKNVLLFRSQIGFTDFRRVDVWWDSPDNGNMMILLAYLITHSKRWNEEDVMIRIFKIAKNKKEADSARETLSRLLDQSRIDNATVEIIVSKDSVNTIIRRNSHNSDLTIIGMPHTKKRMFKNVIKYTEKLKASLIVFAAEKVDLRVN